MPGLKHIYQACTCGEDRCVICGGGLAICVVCKAGEGALLSFCPGYELSWDTQEACYRGNVIDFEWQRKMRMHLGAKTHRNILRFIQHRRSTVKLDITS